MADNSKSVPGVGAFSPFMFIALLFFCSNTWALTNEECVDCHSDTEMTTEKYGETISLYVDSLLFEDTVHAAGGCLSCHVEADVEEDEHPYPMSPVNCANCHDDIKEILNQSAHGKGAMEECNAYVPKCNDCHSKHAIFPSSDKRSTIYPLNLPNTCSRCHREGTSATEKCHTSQHNIVDNYSMSIHGKGLYEDGLIVTAVCTSCHGSHDIQRAGVPDSRVNRENVIETCNKCHVGIVAKFKKSVHSPLVTKTDKILPVCIDCHSSHTISRVSQRDFRLTIGEQCGNCHERQTETYFESYHGRASMLRGGEMTAKCSDCHGSHDIMPGHDPASRINEANIVETCSQCHPKANPSFATYLPHATHSYQDKDKYPYLYYTFWAMTGLLVVTFSLFGIHTILWIPRGIVERAKLMAQKRNGKK